jgi:hypothetical protein
MYRGEHHPTDILGSLIFAGLWLTATSMLLKPNADVRSQPRRAAVVGHRPARAYEKSRAGQTGGVADARK